MSFMDFVKDLGPIVIVLTFIKITFEYIKGLKWKKSEFLSKEIKEFFNDKNVKNVCSLLDWNARKIEIEGEVVLITDEILFNALQTHNNKSKFTETESKLRDMFDQFFDKLSYFNIHINNGLVSQKEVLSYLSYYLNIITEPGRKPKKLVNVFSDYIKYYGFTNVEDLVDKYNKRNAFINKIKNP